jgi:hypothetical protein
LVEVSFNLFEDYLRSNELMLLNPLARQQLGGDNPSLLTFNKSKDMKVGLILNLP